MITIFYLIILVIVWETPVVASQTLQLIFDQIEQTVGDKANSSIKSNLCCHLLLNSRQCPQNNNR